jgi:biopolymer transport protein ExbB/TolQ
MKGMAYWSAGRFVCCVAGLALMCGTTFAQVAAKNEPLTLDSAVKEIAKQHKAGGTTNYFIEFLSIVSLAIVVERFVRLRRSSVTPLGMADEARRLWKEGKYAEIKALCDRQPNSTLSRIIRFVVEHRDAPLADIREATGDIASREIEMHHLFSYPLAAIATLSPLLGLFGTVVGMIEAFDLVALAGNMGDPSILSGSIAKALVTTEFGLVVAMPAIFFFGFFRLRTNMLAHLLEEESSVLMNEWLMKK